MKILLTSRLTFGCLGLLQFAALALAHHSFTAEFDVWNVITLTGTVTKIEWTNPHAHFFMDVGGDRGKVLHWDLELGSPNTLLRDGWTRNSLKVGDVVTVRGYRAKDGANYGSAK
jgi:hypothetical protein